MKNEKSPERVIWLIHGICFVLLNLLVLTAYRYAGIHFDARGEAQEQMDRLVRLFRPLSWFLLAALALSVCALAAAGRKRDKGMDTWYTEVAILIAAAAGVVFVWGNEQLRYGFLARSLLDVISGLVICAMMYFPFLLGILSLIRRGKAGTLAEDCLVIKALCSLREGFEARNDRISSGRQVLFLLVFSLVSCILAFLAGALIVDGRERSGLILLVLLFLLNAWRITSVAKGRRQVYAVFERIAALAGGDVGHKLEAETFRGESRRMAEIVNALDHSLELAVHERTRSERLKTELIANVSHDLRTPLTSIINYVDLIKREKIDNPRVQEYVEILEEKSSRMKSMAEALMEASRASSGNLKISWERIDMVQMIRQVYGEFQEQLEEKQLYAVLRLVEPPAVILADGKILWRVLDNLYTNVCKYAMPGTRVLIELQETAHSLVYTMKNVSAVPLRYTAEELQERFIRGEDSRTTEGSGLGLSIARSMTERLHGKFELYSDEEMFRIRLIFPLADQESEQQPDPPG